MSINSFLDSKLFYFQSNTNLWTTKIITLVTYNILVRVLKQLMIQGTEMKALCSLVFCQSLRKIYRMMGNYQPSPSNKLWFSTAKKLIINEEENTVKNLEFHEPSTFRTQKIIHVKTKNRLKWMLEVKHPCKRVQINKSDV